MLLDFTSETIRHSPRNGRFNATDTGATLIARQLKLQVDIYTFSETTGSIKGPQGETEGPNYLNVTKF